MVNYKIANLNLEMIYDSIYKLQRFKPFLWCDNIQSDLNISVTSSDYITKPEGKLILDEKIKWIRKSSDEDGIYAYISTKKPSEIVYMLEVDNNWRNASITYLKNYVHAEYAITGPLCEITFRNSLLFHNGLTIHASAIKWNNKGIIFSAPSETGKTTQATLWQTHMGAKILNNDRPALRIFDNHICVYGTPWSGPPSQCINDYASLSAVVMLEQAPTNTICLLDKHEALLKLMPRCFLPYYDENLMDIALSKLDKIVNTIPIYLLKCRPDRESVELVYQCVK